MNAKKATQQIVAKNKVQIAENIQDCFRQNINHDEVMKSHKVVSAQSIVSSIVQVTTCPLQLIKVEVEFARQKRFMMRMLPDTGANVNVISAEFVRSNRIPICNKAAVPSVTADGTELKVIGSTWMTVRLGKRSSSLNAIIVEDLWRPILSLQALKDLAIVDHRFPFVQVQASANLTDVQTIELGHGTDLDRLANKYPELFSGRMSATAGGLYHIELTPDAVPSNTGCSCLVPEPYLKALGHEIMNLVTKGVIEPAQGETDWLHPIIVAPKKGSNDIRLYVDLRKLNQFIKRPTNSQQAPWEAVKTNPKGTHHFAVFKALNGFNQIKLDMESRALTTFMTPLGRFRYVRFPIGLSFAEDAFMVCHGNAVDEFIDGRCNEDMLLRAATTSELLEKTEKFFEACKANGIVLNTHKIQWDLQEGLFGGFVLSNTGYIIDPNLALVLQNFPKPDSKTDVRLFLGLINQTGNFTERAAKLKTPFKDLLKVGRKFQWLPEHDVAFEKAREVLSSPSCLAFYDPRRHTKLITGATLLHGLGFLLKQHQPDGSWKIIQVGSRFLCASEMCYSMMELKMLGITWAAKKCANFINGLPQKLFEIHTDHKPLVVILNLPEVRNKRLQCLKTKTDNLNYTAHWIPTRENEAEVLSRFPVEKANTSDELDETDDDTAVAAISNIVPVLEENDVDPVVMGASCGEEAFKEINPKWLNSRIVKLQLEELWEEANKDVTYNKLKKAICYGFAEPPEEALRPFLRYINEIHIDPHGFICFNGRLFIPTSLQSKMIEQLKKLYKGVKKMRARARKSIWWPCMNIDIKNAAQECDSWKEWAPSIQADAKVHHKPATFPFQFVHSDMASCNGQDFLIIIDQFSGWPEVFHCGKAATIEFLWKCFQTIFARFGIPVAIFSGRGPQFQKKFSDMCNSWGISHIASPAYQPQSNGMTEVTVKYLKKLIIENFISASDSQSNTFNQSLVMFRNTPCRLTNLSPSQILFGQQLHDFPQTE
jgi:hypothetical protein